MDYVVACGGDGGFDGFLSGEVGVVVYECLFSGEVYGGLGYAV